AGLATASGGGSLVNNGNCFWTYTSAANDSRVVRLSSTINDGQGGSVAGSATLDITPVNDAPTTSPVTLTSIAEDSGPRTVTTAKPIANAADEEGESRTATGRSIESGSGSPVKRGTGTSTSAADG